MSASEKLRALDADVRSDEAFEVLRTEIATDALLAALPQIVAVVEKGQRVYEHVERTYPAGVAVDPVFREFAAALAALDQELP